MKGNVKRHFSPRNWNTRDSRDVQPPRKLCTANSRVSGLHRSALMLRVAFVSHDARVQHRPDVKLRKQDVVAMATQWFYRRLEAYSFVRLSEGA